MPNEGETVANHVSEMHQHDEHMMAAMYGPWKPPEMGRVRDEECGMVHQVNTMWEQTQGAGLKTKLSAIDRAGIWAVVAALVATLAGVGL